MFSRELNLVAPSWLVVVFIGLSVTPIQSVDGEEPSAAALTATNLPALSEALTDPDPKLRLQAAQALRALGSEAAPVATSVARVLQAADGATRENLVAAYLEALRAMGPDASIVSPLLSSLLKESSALYRDRDKHEVERLRVYVLVVSTEIGITKDALPQIVDWLVNSDKDMGVHFAAAARATGSLGPAARPLTRYLLEGMQRYYHRDEFSLERYDPDYPRAEATTVQFEGIRALGRICGNSDVNVVTLLNTFSNGTHLDTRRYPNLIETAKNALREIKGRSIPKIGTPAASETDTGTQ